MSTVLKVFCGIFILIGLAISSYGAREIVGTVFLVKDYQEHVKGVFTGYESKAVVTSNTGKDLSGYRETGTTSSLMYYPQFEFITKDGVKHQVTESKSHIFRLFKPGQELEVIVSPYGEYRLAGFYSLYFLDLCILVFGLLFIIVPLLFWIFAIPSFAADKEFARQMNDDIKAMFNTKVVGPITAGAIIKGFLLFFLVIFLVGMGIQYAPYFIKQNHLGTGWRLMEAMQKGNFDEARGLILKREGINQIDQFGRSPLFLALESGRFDLACLLVEAGADVNVEYKWFYTPLRYAAEAGDLELVKLLLIKGASPDPPEGQFPPVAYALAQKHYDVARVLIESKCDLKRLYKEPDGSYTIGDYTILAGRPELTELVRSRGGLITVKTQQ